MPTTTFATRLTLGSEPIIGQLYNAFADQLLNDTSFCGANSIPKVDIKNQDDVTELRRLSGESNPYVDVILDNGYYDERLKKFQVDNDLKIISVDLQNDGNIDKSLFSSIPNDATHVVTGIEYGVQLGATFTWDADVKDDDLPLAIKELHAFIDLVMTNIIAPQTTQSSESLEKYSGDRKFKLKEWHSTPELMLPLPVNTNMHASFLTKFLQKFPKSIENVAPIRIILCPLTEIFSNNSSPSWPIPLFIPIDGLTMKHIFAFFDDFMQGELLLNEREEFLSRHNFCVDPRDREFISLFIAERRKIWSEIKQKLRQQLKTARHGSMKYDALRETATSYTKSKISLEYAQKILTAQERLLEKIHYIQKLQDRGGRYYNDRTNVDWLNTVQKVYVEDVNCYVFFCNWNSSDETFLINKQMFDRLLYSKENFCILIEENVNKISYYNKGGLVYDNLVQGARQIVSTEFAFAQTDKHQKVLPYYYDQPANKIELKVRCPKSGCDQAGQFWLCDRCMQYIEYGFDEFYYCHCGKAPIQSYKYKCADKNHGAEFVGFNPNEFKALLQEIKPLKEINILVLGETGVGKSTWINAIANYASFGSLQEAMEAPIVHLLPVKFSIQDDKYQDHVVSLGYSENETFKKGQSSTQGPKAYAFKMGDKLIRIIDTPGIGDTQGCEEDQIHTANILEFLSGYKQLHGICILINTTNSRLTENFRYCINGLLIQLHKSATANIVFCFTFSRGSMYKPGLAKEPLSEFLKEIREQRGITIPMKYETMYCLDNDSFRFLCCYHSGIFSDSLEPTFSESWKISVAETNRLFNYVFQLSPHNLLQTISLNACRQIILAMSKPLVDVYTNIADNIAHLESRKKAIQENSNNTSETTQIDIHIVPLEHGRLKCLACNGRICHEKCDVTDGTEAFPNSKVKNCKLFRRFNFLWVIPCKACGCNWDKHEHVTFEQETRVVPVNTNREFARIEDIEELQNRIQLYTEEYNIISKTFAKFGAFLKQNAILQYNDAFASYVQKIIKGEEAKCSINNYESYKLKKLRELLKQYEKDVEILRGAMESAYATKINSAVDETKDEQEIFKLQEELFALKLNGDSIKMLYNQVVMCKLDYKKYNETVFDTKLRGPVTSEVGENNVKDFVRDAIYATKIRLRRRLSMTKSPLHSILKNDKISFETVPPAPVDNIQANKKEPSTTMKSQQQQPGSSTKKDPTRLSMGTLLGQQSKDIPVIKFFKTRLNQARGNDSEETKSTVKLTNIDSLEELPVEKEKLLETLIEQNDNCEKSNDHKSPEENKIYDEAEAEDDYKIKQDNKHSYVNITSEQQNAIVEEIKEMGSSLSTLGRRPVAKPRTHVPK